MTSVKLLLCFFSILPLAHAESPLGPFDDINDPFLFANYTNYVRKRIEVDGYVFLPDTPFVDASSFSNWWMELFPARQFDYSQGAVVREASAPGVYAVAAERPEMQIYPHIEAAYLHDQPEYMIIFCPEPCRDGKGTTLASSDRIQREVHWRLRELYDAILQDGVTYIEYFPSETSSAFDLFQEHSNPTALRFEGLSQREVERVLQSTRPGAEIAFHADGSVLCKWTLPGFTSTSTGSQKWINSILLSHSMQYKYVGNATPPWQVRIGTRSVSESEWLTLRDIHLEEQLMFNWRRGSALVWDNLKFHHGRPPLQTHLAQDRVCFESYAGYIRRDLRLRQDVALTHRLMARHGITYSRWTHMSAKLDDHNILLTPFVAFEEVNASSLIALNLATGHLIPGVNHMQGRLNPATLPLHRAVYAACDHCSVVIHAHHKAIIAVSALKEGFMPVDQSFFGLPPIFYVNSSAVVHGNEADRLAAALKNMGASRGLLVLSNNGVISFGTSVSGTYLRLWYAIRVAEIQVMTLSMRSVDEIKTYPDADDAESISLFQAESGSEFEAWRRLEIEMDDSFMH